MKILDSLRNHPLLSAEIHKLESRMWRRVRRDGLQAIMLTSPGRGDGKSTTVAYLAAAMGVHPGRRVLAVDFDMREPRLNDHFELDYQCDLGMILRGECPLQDGIQKTDIPGLDLLLPSREGDDPDLLLRTTDLSEMMGSLRQEYDIILVDVPALIPVADASILMPLVDGVVLVAMAGKTNRVELGRAREICLGMGANILGLVIGNLQEALPEYGQYSYGYGYGRRGANGNGDHGSTSSE